MEHGHGTYHYGNGNKYVGQWKDGERSGKGIKNYANGFL